MDNRKIHAWGVRSEQAAEILGKIISSLQAHPINFANQLDIQEALRQILKWTLY